MTGGTRPPQLPGHEVVGTAGFGANGAVWSARDRSGRDVVISVLALPPGEAGTAQLRRLAALRPGAHPHLACIRQVLALDGARCAVVSDRVPGPTLATVLAARGSLRPPELAGLLSALGSALGHLHERGVVHGDVSPANVVVTGDGVPVLVDLAGQGAHELGTPGFVPPERERGSVAGAPGDVWALARLVEWAAGPVPDPHLLRLLGPALDAVPDRRPSARDLASRAPGIGPAAPVAVPPAAALAQARMRDDVATTRRRAPTRREREAERSAGRPAGTRGRVVAAQAAGTAPAGRPGPATAGGGPAPPGRTAARAVPGAHARAPAGPARATQAARHVREQALPTPWLGGALTLGVAALLTGLIVWSAPGERSAGYGHGPAAMGAEQYTQVVGTLLARRDGALVAGDAAALAATTVPGGPAAREDVALLDRLAATGTELENLRTEVGAVDGVTAVDEGVAVDVVLVQEAHERVVAGRRTTVPAQEPACARLVLEVGPGEAWRLLDSGPCP
ncbi:Protein kinase domain-containing protein [Georgenia satyanarayanai]|uniref:non-specific serine/threonine protein kinase n=1 Tax=Georgenia satyanarayanai TaxID=860221 RepID=A0A2Y8ZWT3_9MICO|nr:protein kinase-like protein [Georgenia satyanarayanai]SSA36781.1 Protein kinase domain-containing protein [Georgenia satyanarayanai]